MKLVAIHAWVGIGHRALSAVCGPMRKVTITVDRMRTTSLVKQQPRRSEDRSVRRNGVMLEA